MIKLKTLLQYKLFLLLILIIVIILSYIRVNNYSYKYEIGNQTIEGIIIDKKIDGNKMDFIIKAKEKIKCTYYIEKENDINYYSNITLGTRVLLNGDVSLPNNNTIKNIFNYKNYLLSNNIKIILNVKTITIIKENNNLLYKIKNNIINHISKYKSSNYLFMFIIGNKSYLDNDIKDNYKNLGVSHIFAISGMHISILSLILFKILGFIKEKYRYILIIFFLLFYSFICNFQVSIVRSILLYILLFINKEYDYNLDIINVYYLTIIIILLIFPYYLINTSFLYSSLISYILIRYNDLIIGKYLTKLIKISILSLLISLPITINNNYEFNILSIINNIIFVPLISFIIYPISLLTFIFPFLDNIYLNILNILELISTKLLVINIIIPRINVLMIIIYYFLLYLLFNTFKKKYLIFIILLLLFIKIKPFFNNNLYVNYLDVSQGDSIFISYNKYSILIDTGGKIEYEQEKWKERKNTYSKINSSILFFKSMGYSHIDYLIISHGDYDHMGWSINLVENFKVENVIFNCGEYNDLEKELISVLEKKNINYYSCIKELNIDKYKLQFLNTGVYDNENDNSSVIYLNYNNYKFLFMGDVSTKREKDILEKYNLKDIDFLKVGHHGSNTSSSEEFINSINPKYSLISVGKNNRYGHPKESVLDILEKSKIYRTDVDGSIEIKLNKSGYKIRTCSP